MQEINRRLHALIVQSGLSYAELAQLTGISKSALQRYATGETEKIPLNRLEALAVALHTTPAALSGWELPERTVPNAAQEELTADLDFFAGFGAESEWDSEICTLAARYREINADPTLDRRGREAAKSELLAERYALASRKALQLTLLVQHALTLALETGEFPQSHHGTPLSPAAAAEMLDCIERILSATTDEQRQREQLAFARLRAAARAQ